MKVSLGSGFKKYFAFFLSALFLWVPLSPSFSFASAYSHCGMKQTRTNKTSMLGLPEIPGGKMVMGKHHCNHAQGNSNCAKKVCLDNEAFISSCGNMSGGEMTVVSSGSDVIPASFLLANPPTLHLDVESDKENSHHPFLISPYRPPIV